MMLTYFIYWFTTFRTCDPIYKTGSKIFGRLYHPCLCCRLGGSDASLLWCPSPIIWDLCLRSRLCQSPQHVPGSRDSMWMCWETSDVEISSKFKFLKPRPSLLMSWETTTIHHAMKTLVKIIKSKEERRRLISIRHNQSAHVFCACDTRLMLSACLIKCF